MASIGAGSRLACRNGRRLRSVTQLLLKGADDLALVQEALGHRDARTTRIYTTVKVNPRLIAAVKKAFGA